MKIKPTNDRFLAVRVEKEQKTAGGIIIADTAKEKPREAKWLPWGPAGEHFHILERQSAESRQRPTSLGHFHSMIFCCIIANHAGIRIRTYQTEPRW